MKTMVVVFVLLLAGIAGLGFYRGWFRLSTDSTDQKPSATIMVDQEQFRDDEQLAREKVQNFGQEAKEKTGEWAGKDQEPEGRP